ncbi:MAG: hypothetical protein ABJ360_21510 [Roseobacter sp.]
MDYDNAPPFEITRYREMQKALPGVAALYRLTLAIPTHSANRVRLLA